MKHGWAERPRGQAAALKAMQQIALGAEAKALEVNGKKVNLPVKGIIENMSWFTGDDGKRYHLFGSGGGSTRRLSCGSS